MDRVSGNSSSTANMSYDPNSCELSPPKGGPQASCPDGSVAYEGDVCAATGLKGPLTASQRYAAALAAGNTSSDAPRLEAAALTSPPNPQGPSLEERAAVSSMIDEARNAAIEGIRTFLKSLQLEAGHKIDHSLALPNGCELNFSVEGTLEKNAAGQPVLVGKVSGSIEGSIGAVSAQAQLSYSSSSDGAEVFSFEACVFGGLDHDAAKLVELKAKAGVCATYSDAAGAPAELALDAVVQVGAKMDLTWLGVAWSPQAEARYPLSHEPAYDVIR